MSFYETDSEIKGYFYTRNGVTPWYTPPHFHGSIELLFCMQGEQELTVGGETHTLRAGDSCFIDSYTIHSLKPSTNTSLYVFLGDKHYFEPIFSSFGGCIPPAFFRFENELFLSFLHDLGKEKYQNEVGRYEMNEGICKLLIAEIAKSVPFEKRKTNRQNDLVSSVLRHAAEHLSDDLSLTTLAKTFGYSHEHFSRILHRHLGENWNRYVNRLRVRSAHDMLVKNPSTSVLEIAMQCGFESPNTFYRAYHQEYGTPPRQR